MRQRLTILLTALALTLGLAMPASALTVTVTGPDPVWVPFGECVWATWTTTSSYQTYDWTFDSAQVGTASSYSKRFCSPELDIATSDWHAVAVYVTSSGAAAYDDLAFNVIYQAGDENGPCGFQAWCD